MALAQGDQTPTYDQANKLLAARQEELKQCEREVEIIRSEVERISKLYDNKQAQLRVADSEFRAKQYKQDTGLDIAEVGLTMDVERRRQEMDRNIKELVHDMVMKRIPLAPQAEQKVEDGENKRISTLFVHSVKVNYIKNLKDGDIERFTKAQARTAVFRITQTTTLTDLRKTVCDFWGIEHPETMSLRASNMSYISLLTKEDKSASDAASKGSDYVAREVPLYRLFADNKVFPELWLLESNPQCSRLFPNQEDFYEKGENKPKEKGASRTTEQGYINNYKKFLAKFPGITAILPPKIKADKDKEEKPYFDQNTSCLTFSIMLIIIILTGIVVFSRMDMGQTYSIQYSISTKMAALFNGFGFNDITFVTQLTDFYMRILPAVLLPPTQGGADDSLLRGFHLIGSIRFRQLRTKSRSCVTSYTNFESDEYQCYYADYGESTKETADILTGDMPWRTYRSEADTGVSSVYNGFLASYDGSGYVMDFYANTTLESFQNYYVSMVAHGWISEATRAIFLTFTLYDPSTNMWAFVRNVIEIGAGGSLVPTPLTPIVFRPNVFETLADGSVASADVIRFVLSFYFLVLTFREVASRKSGRWRFKLKYFLSGSFIRDFICFVLILVGFGIDSSLKLDTASVLAKNEYVELQQYASDFWAAIHINIIAIMFVFLRLMQVLKAFPSPKVVLTTMSKTFSSMVAYLVLICPLIMGLSIASINIWGPYMTPFHTMLYAFTTNILISLGLLDALNMYLINAVWTVFFIICSFFVWTFYLVCVFRGVYLDSRMSTRQKLGYEEVPQGSKFVTFGWWFIGFLPHRLLINLREWLEARRERKKTEELESEKEQTSQRKLEDVDSERPATADQDFHAK